MSAPTSTLRRHFQELPAGNPRSRVFQDGSKSERSAPCRLGDPVACFRRSAVFVCSICVFCRTVTSCSGSERGDGARINGAFARMRSCARDQHTRFSRSQALPKPRSVTILHLRSSSHGDHECQTGRRRFDSARGPMGLLCLKLLVPRAIRHCRRYCPTFAATRDGPAIGASVVVEYDSRQDLSTMSRRRRRGLV